MDNKMLLAIMGVLLLFSISNAIVQLRGDVRRINSVLEKIAKQIGVPEPPVDGEIKALIAEGKKVTAVKRYRDITGVGLKEAKDYVDKLM